MSRSAQKQTRSHPYGVQALLCHFKSGPCQCFSFESSDPGWCALGRPCLWPFNPDLLTHHHGDENPTSYPTHSDDTSISQRSSCQRSVQWLCEWCLPVDEAESCWACAGAWNLGTNVENCVSENLRYQSEKNLGSCWNKGFVADVCHGKTIFLTIWENMFETFSTDLKQIQEKGLGWWRKKGGTSRGGFLLPGWFQILMFDLPPIPVTVITSQDYYIFST